MPVRHVLWIVLCLVAGGPCAFLALEGIGAPVLEMVLALVAAGFVIVGTRHHVLAETLVAFGLTYSIVITGFAVPNLLSSTEQHDVASAAYFAAHLAVAGAIVLSGCWMLLTRPGRLSGLGARSHAGR
jgi:hypothetical protein